MDSNYQHFVGIDWATVEPREGAFDQAALDAYAEMARACSSSPTT